MEGIIPKTHREAGITNIGSVTIYVSDPYAALKFYTEILGFELRMDAAGWIEVAPPGALTTLVLMKRTEGGEQCHPMVHFTVEDTHATYLDLLARGVKCRMHSKPQTFNMAIFEDPDGNEIIITSEPRRWWSSEGLR